MALKLSVADGQPFNKVCFSLPESRIEDIMSRPSNESNDAWIGRITGGKYVEEWGKTRSQLKIDLTVHEPLSSQV